jgi:hypothetical protein
VTTDPAPAGEPVDNPFDVPELNLLDDGSIRRAVRRGIVLTGLVAAAWLLLATVVLYIGGVVVVAVHTKHFHDLAYYGAQVGRPGYVVNGNSCCLGSLGLSSAQELELHQRGALGPTGQVTGRVWRGFTGTLGSVLPDENATPIGAALQRERPTKAGTTAFLGTLPPMISASAIIEFSTPLDEAALENFPFNDTGSLSSSDPRALLFANPYEGQVVSWPEHSVVDFPDWVATLTPDDDNELDELGAPSVAVLRTAAKSPRIYAAVVEQATIGDLQALLKNPRVRSVNVAEVGFDPARQNLDN